MNQQHQADLVEMIPLAGDNNGFRYILTVIDCFSRYAWAAPVKNNSGHDIVNAFKTHIYTSQELMPRRLQTDQGKEIYNAIVLDYLTQYNIELFSIFSPFKACIVERLNRTLKKKMWKWFTYRDNFYWLDILPKIVNTYNRTIHFTIKMPPIKVNKKNEHLVWKILNKKKSKIRQILKLVI